MNVGDSKSSQNQDQPSLNPSEKEPKEQEPVTTPAIPPLSSPEENFPSEPSRDYSSDPSQYAYPSQPSSEEPVKTSSTESHTYTAEPIDTGRISSEEKRSSSFSQNEQEKEKIFRETADDKTKDSSWAFRDTKRMDELYRYAVSDKVQTITYILLILGLLLMIFYNNLLGGLIIGMVTGFYFASEIIYAIRNVGQVIGRQDYVRYIVLAAFFLGLFIAAPGIFIGSIIVAAFKQLIEGPRSSTRNNKDSNSL